MKEEGSKKWEGDNEQRARKRAREEMREETKYQCRILCNFLSIFFPRYKELDRARDIFQRFVMCHPEVKNWIRWARFEQKHQFVNKAREIFEQAVEFFGEEYMDEKLYIAFAQFEEGQKVSQSCCCY